MRPTHPQKSPSQIKRPLGLAALSLLLWSFDFKSSGAAQGLLIQAPLLGFHFIAFFMLMRAFAGAKASFAPLRLFLFLSLSFLLPSFAVGFARGQPLWPLITNSISFLIFLTTTLGSFAALTLIEKADVYLDKLKTICFLFVIFHFCVILVMRGGINIETSRYEVLSGAVIPASAILAIGAFLRFKLKEALIAGANLAIIILSVTRTQLAVLAGQIASVVLAFPQIAFRPSTVKRALLVFLVALVVLGGDLLAGGSLTGRWVQRFSSNETIITDPTALTRIAEVNFMMDSFTSSFDTIFFGNGLAAKTKLTGDAALLAGSLVGFGSVMSVHGEGYGHNNHASMLFIGGLLFGMPLLLLLFVNGVQSLALIRRLLKDKATDASLVYVGLWGALIVIGELACGFLSGTFSDRPACLWYGVGTGMLYWARTQMNPKEPKVPLLKEKAPS